jgi:DNA-binding response OmpR family regulator
VTIPCSHGFRGLDRTGVAGGMARRVLVVEDDPDIADLLTIHLRDLGCSTALARDGPTGAGMAAAGVHDLIVLDLMLPGMDGLDICRQVRRSSRYTPILVLTARSSDVDRVLGLELGADDYVTKPFNLLELLARVKALFRRVDALRTAGEAPSVIRAGDLVIELEERRVTVRGREIELTPKEFELLTQFARRPGRVYTRSQLLDLVWGSAHQGYEHTVNSHINRLRSKIEDDPANPRYVRTVWGVGYKFDVETRARA